MATGDHFETRAIHAGEPRPRHAGAGVLPIYQCTVFAHGEGGSGSDGAEPGVVYPRLSNLPNHRALSEKAASLEGAEDAVVTASGMAAISTALLSTLRSGDHLIAIDSIYGGTFGLLRDVLPDLGIEATLVDVEDRDSWEKALRPGRTTTLYSEALTNPLVRVPDHVGLVGFARDHGLTSVIDATFASPCSFRPLEHGYDLVVHSATKYLNGHSDITAGVVAGNSERMQRVRHRLDLLGGTLDAHACFLLQRGMRTLGLRVERQNQNALALAHALGEFPTVTRVHYPGLPTHPDHERARSLFDGGRCGGVLSFELATESAPTIEQLFERLTLATPAPSLGGVETLITAPRMSSHAGLTAAERAAMGVSEQLVRVAVGIEHPDDLVADFTRALG